MFTLELINEANQRIELTHNPNYTVFNIEGLTSQKADINLTESALLDGAAFNSAKVNARNIVIYAAVETPVETNRIALYKYVKAKKPLRVHFKNGTRDILVRGYCDSADLAAFDQKQVMQISILCPDAFLPALYSEGESYGYEGDDNVFTIDNYGDVDTPFSLQGRLSGDVVGFTVMNNTTGEYFKINGTIPTGVLTVNTATGGKVCTLRDANDTYNLINQVDMESSWFKLSPGENEIEIWAESGFHNARGTFTWRPLYVGV